MYRARFDGPAGVRFGFPPAVPPSFPPFRALSLPQRLLGASVFHVSSVRLCFQFLCISCISCFSCFSCISCISCISCFPHFRYFSYVSFLRHLLCEFFLLFEWHVRSLRRVLLLAFPRESVPRRRRRDLRIHRGKLRQGGAPGQRRSVLPPRGSRLRERVQRVFGGRVDGVGESRLLPRGGGIPAGL